MSVLILLLSLVGADWATTLKDAEKQIPRLEVMFPTGERGLCSGVMVDHGVVLTAAHCLADKAEVTVNGRHGKVMSLNHILDLAIVTFSPKHEVPLPLAAAAPLAGSDVAILGYPFGSETFHVQRGIVSAPYDRECKCLKLNGDVIPGDSGGAIVNEKGELIGLTTMIFYNGPAHLAGAVPLDAIKDFLQDFKDEQTKKK